MHAVRTEYIRIGVVFAILMAIAAWQFGFVITAIGANPALNFIILGTFIFGLTLVARLMRTLRNEFRALFALYELYDDTIRSEDAEKADPFWRYYRCKKVAIVFDRPQILGQSYNLVREQLLRDEGLSISAGTMETLLGGIDQRLVESRSLVGYVSGILIFLGLIGTFIGLMVTLSSVGAIIGDLDLTSADPTETVSTLMANLQTPLGGMATGFSSSLFGLVTSLTLSVMVQMLSRAGRSLRAEFSDWLTNVVELSDAGDNASNSGERSAVIEERRLSLLMKTARFAVQGQQRQARAMETLSHQVTELTEAQGASERRLSEIADATLVMSEQQKVLHRALARSIEAVQALGASASMRDEVAELTALMSVQLEARDSRLATAMEDIHAKLSDLGRPHVPSDTSDEGDELICELTTHAGELNLEQINKLLAAVYQTGSHPGSDAAPTEVDADAEDNKATGVHGR